MPENEEEGLFFIKKTIGNIGRNWEIGVYLIKTSEANEYNYRFFER
jgi:hypothetical protein